MYILFHVLCASACIFFEYLGELPNRNLICPNSKYPAKSATRLPLLAACLL